MSLKLYIDLMSQPSRALYVLLKKSNAKFDTHIVKLDKREHLSEQFQKINPLQKVPVIDHNGFLLSESVAILGYLARQKVLPKNLYPNDVSGQARVEEFLAWQHVGLRLPLCLYFFSGFLDPMRTGVAADPKKVEMFKLKMEEALKLFETKWLGRGAKFVIGEELTVADVIAACEIEQPRLLGYKASEKYENIAEWLKNVRQECSPHYDEAYKLFDIVANKNAAV